MTAEALIAECRARGITLEVTGDRLRCRAPAGVLTKGIKDALVNQKDALMQILAPPLPAQPLPLLADDREAMAVLVWSDTLQEALGVVADDVPRHEWPSDGVVYQHVEVKILKRVEGKSRKPRTTRRSVNASPHNTTRLPGRWHHQSSTRLLSAPC